MKQQATRRIPRRAVLAGIAAALASRPQIAPAQQRDGMHRIGVLMGPRADDPETQARAAALVQGLGALGWTEGGNLRIDWRWGGGDPALYARYAAELVALGPEVLLANGTAATEALRRRTGSIPIVFTNVADPVAAGFVASLARPGGNVTGFSSYESPMVGKMLQMLTQVTPPVARVAVLFNPATALSADVMLRVIEDAAPSLKLEVRAAPVHDDGEIETTMAQLAHEERGGLVVLGDAFITAHRDAIVANAARYRLPAVYYAKYIAAAGGLMSYGADFVDLHRRAAAYVDRLLKGAKASDLPVQNPTKFELVINLKTAKALGVTIATPLLATADEVIE